MESEFLQREVLIHISPAAKDSLTGYIVSQTQADVRKVLLSHGFAKLAKDAINGISTQEFMELKGIAEKALDAGKGLWKEQKTTKSSSSNKK